MAISQDRMKAFVETICYCKGVRWLNSQYGLNNWTTQELEMHPDYPHGKFWCEDDLWDLIYINNLDCDYVLEWLENNRSWWEEL